MAQVASSYTTITALLKQHYKSPSFIQNSMIDYGPLLSKLLQEADTGADGINTPVPLIYSGGGGFSSSVSAAYNFASPAAVVNFLMTLGTTFGQVILGGQALAASENPDGSFIPDLALEVDTKERRLKEYMAALVYGDQTGAMAQVGSISTQSSGPTQGVITLADPALAAKFQVNDVINVGIGSASAASFTINTGAGWVLSGCLSTPNVTGLPQAGSGLGQTYAQIAYIIAVNIPAGTIQVSRTQGGAAATLAASAGVFYGNDVNLNSGIAAGSFIFFNGDATIAAATPIVQAGVVNTGGTGPALLPGLVAWSPPGGPVDTGTYPTGSFYGVNRNGNSAFYGQFIDATAAGLNLGTIRASLTNGVAQIRQVGGKPKAVYLHWIAWYRLSTELQSQGMYPGSSGQGPSGAGSFGFTSLMLPTDVGSIEVFGDPQCLPCYTNPTYAPASGYSGALTAFILDDQWEILSLGDAPHLDETDGNYFLRIQGTDNYQIQSKAYWTLCTHRPNGSVMVALPQ